MPLDGHSYLVSQGWSGHGTGLRHDSIIRPLAIPQKRTLSGLGKDRDEAFPFWDHLFSVAAKTIQVKLSKDDGDSSSDESNSPPFVNTQLLDRTSTGILSNKAPKHGIPASASASGSVTPTLAITSIPPSSSLNLLATAKREAAKRTLYSRFFRGPLLGPDSSDSTILDTDSNSVVESAPSTKKRKIEDTFEWDAATFITPVPTNGGRTPMAIAKAKLADVKDDVIPISLKTTTFKVQDRKRKRDEGDEGRGMIRKKKKRSKDSKGERKEKEKAERERAEKKKKGPGEKQIRLKEVGESEEKKPRKHKCSDPPLTVASVSGKVTTETDDGCLPRKGKEKEKAEGRRQRKDKQKKKNKGEDEDEDEHERRKRERKVAKKPALATPTSPKPDTDIDTTNGSPSNPDPITPATLKSDILESKKKTKRRSTVD